ncbi:hypothetical protein DICPUDRAFT_47873 [Dictyostelium purpureum]|uniref:ABC transporter C family protein n=1 Tax=Dictyostelium purpureum TaxID=5786 RepID=F0ZLS3_DICPU|nr:uncharacterized protein DICPUDRAFT_47873 [Dictyostelium purpureum]EGC35107.1 hypothetical protein DICPUDRAFT_47873 [Dictyostelium purpureum]|eukprot:XP_003288359.1 hypothetical protein DICPUDRAFT_47873 [Dictyostelium purpureum]
MGKNNNDEDQEQHQQINDIDSISHPNIPQQSNEFPSIDEIKEIGELEENKKKEKKIKHLGFGGKPSAEENSNIISKATFGWADKFVWHCYRNVLQIDHIWELASYDKSEYLSKKIEEAWKIEMKKPKPKYLRAAFRAFGGYFILSWLFYAIYAASQFVGPEIISRMVKFVTASINNIDTGEDPNMGYYYSLILFCSSMIGSFCLYQSNMISARTGDRLRSIIVLDVYKKSLNLSNSARANSSPGEIVNLMSNDAQRMVEVFQLVNNGVFALPQIIVCIALLYRAIGWPTFVGLGLMILSVPLNGLSAKKLTEIRRKLVDYTDARVKTTNEILQAIKIIKLYAWEDSFARKVIQRRDAEIKLLFQFSRYRAVLIVVVAALPTAVSVLVFSSYYGYHKRLNAAEIFSALSYLNILRLPLGFLPIIIALAVQMQVAADRVTKFLMLPEMKPVHETQDPSKPNGIYIKNATLSWNIEKKDENFVLKNIDLEATGKSLTMVVGSVGSGKSSLLQATLGEMDVIDGDVSIKGSIAYVPQQAWIINATLKDNILFGKPYDEEKYRKILDVCALERDIELFPQGDQIEIGERGVNLSGGQKQRVSIARAVYSDADIFILDDPLSAVDAHVGKHLFHKCFKGILKNKTVILAANQLNYLPFATDAIVLKNGEISERGNYQQLVSSQKEFSHLLKAYGVDEIKDHDLEIDVPDDEEEIVIEEKIKSTKTNTISKASGSLTSQEEREEGAVAFWVYWKYITVGGGVLFLVTFIFFLLETGSRTFVDWWLSHWQTVSTKRAIDPTVNELSDTQFLGIYIGIGITSIIISCFRNFLFFDYTVRASRALHHQLFNALLRAPMWFFDITPLGRIINRFTRDLDGIDNLIATAMAQFIVFITSVMATLILISIITPFLLIPLGPICIIFYILQFFYRYTSRELQRLESISRSPIFSHFSETLGGVVSIRAYKKQYENILTNHARLDNNNKCYLTLQAMNQWLGLRLDFLANLVTFFACIFITIDRGTLSAANVGLSLSYALTLTGNLNRATLQMSDTETKMNSVERICHYIKGPVESLQITDIRPPPNWPEQGSIKFEDFYMSYREGLDPVLKGISIEIHAKEKIGIVGRTGSGKSSTLVGLFRLVEPNQGRILIDGLDISTIGLKDLRRNLSIIPQDPVLFSGTLRENLDPFREHDDGTLWSLLEDIQLNTAVQSLEGGLDCKVSENGDNWSVGQRQLICLGRALLRKPKILVLDEATASVDGNTDSLIQKCVKEKFNDCTILTIAHRLNTIMDSDRIMVLDAGRVSEFDTPWNLLQDPNGLLTWLVEETGPQNSIYLRNLAQAKKDGLDIFSITPPHQKQHLNDSNGDIDNINSPSQNINNNSNSIENIDNNINNVDSGDNNEYTNDNSFSTGSFDNNPANLYGDPNNYSAFTPNSEQDD